MYLAVMETLQIWYLFSAQLRRFRQSRRFRTYIVHVSATMDTTETVGAVSRTLSVLRENHTRSGHHRLCWIGYAQLIPTASSLNMKSQSRRTSRTAYVRHALLGRISRTLARPVAQRARETHTTTMETLRPDV